MSDSQKASRNYGADDTGVRRTSATVSTAESAPGSQDQLVNEEEHVTYEPIQWLNIIFLPFNPTFKLVVLIFVFIKCFIGPLQSSTPFIYCPTHLDDLLIDQILKILYLYVCDAVYFIDFFLHIAHRQVQEEAVKREHMPKSGAMLILDVMALTPLHQLFQHNMCQEVRFWPNIVGLHEGILIYRFVEYFSLVSSHSVLQLSAGYAIIAVFILHMASLLTNLLTNRCFRCNNITDWRTAILERIPRHFKDNYIARSLMYYLYTTQNVAEYFFCNKWDAMMPRNQYGLLMNAGTIIIGFVSIAFVANAKLFAEFLMRMRRLDSFIQRAERVVGETARRTHRPLATYSVVEFYNTIWTQRQGLTMLTSAYHTLPEYMRTDIRMDLAWPLFYHSPNLRKTSFPFKRYVAVRTNLTYRMPNEPFFIDSPGSSQLYYLKAGVVRLVSAEDPVTPLLSLSSGTLLGDVNFFLPQRTRQMKAKCTFYCEVLTVRREDMIKSMHLFPEDRHHIMKETKERFKHARSLFACKEQVLGLDRSEHEGMAWLRERWWQLTLAMRKIKRSRHKELKYLPADDCFYHCSKYLGQIVLSAYKQLQRKTIFIKDQFPYVLSPRSEFISKWHQVMVVTTFVLLLIFPPNLTRLDNPKWFNLLMGLCDIVFLFDVVLTMVTASDEAIALGLRPGSVTTLFTTLKSGYFWLDVMSTNIFDSILSNQLFRFNRFLKLNILFRKKYIGDWQIGRNSLVIAYYHISLIYLIGKAYVFAYFFHLISRSLPHLITRDLWFGSECSTTHDYNCVDQVIRQENPLLIARVWCVGIVFGGGVALLPMDSLLIIFTILRDFVLACILSMYLQVVLYLNYRPRYEYQTFVRNLIRLCVTHKIHPDLLLRLKRYLECHWKYYHGMDIMQPHVLRDEPFDVYYHLHGEVAERIISTSEPFLNAERPLIRTLAYHARFLIMPKGATIVLFGSKNENISWLVKGWVRCEFNDDEGNLQRRMLGEGSLLSRLTVFLKRPAMHTFCTATDCEILYIPVKEYESVLRTFPREHYYFQTCITEIGPLLDEVFLNYAKKHKKYQKNLRASIFHARQHSLMGLKAPGNVSGGIRGLVKHLFKWFRSDPESTFMQLWWSFRVVTVFASVICSSLQASTDQRTFYSIILYFVDFVNVIGIGIKFFLPFYDKRGLIISHWRHTFIKYGTRSFILDLLPLLPWSLMIDDKSTAMMIGTLLRWLQMCLVIGYFEYMSDHGAANVILLKMMKFLVILISTLFAVGHYFIAGCTKVDDKDVYRSGKFCWLAVDPESEGQAIPPEKIARFYIINLSFAHDAMMMTETTSYKKTTGLYITVPFMAVCLLTWLIKCRIIAVLVMATRGDTLFQHSLNQLRRFLESERIEKSFIDYIHEYFVYQWTRTRGINVETLMTERLSTMFRQDLNFYYYKHSVSALDTVLQGGEPLQRELAGLSSVEHFLPGADIAREMDFTPHVFIVHRGHVTILTKDRKLTTLTKGCIFGQLDGHHPRALRITARAEDHVDCLRLNLRDFHNTLTPMTRQHLTSHPNSSEDFITLRKKIIENPYNTVRYILREDFVIKLPRMVSPVEAAKSKWLQYYMMLSQALCPFLVVALLALHEVIHPDLMTTITGLLVITDVVQFTHIFIKLFQMELDVVQGKLMLKYIFLAHFRSAALYVDTISLLGPLLSPITGHWWFHYCRLVRVHLYFSFYRRLSKSIQSGMALILMKLGAFLLIINVSTCVCIRINCKRTQGEMNMLMRFIRPPMPWINRTIDKSIWSLPTGVELEGCVSDLVNFSPDGKTIHTPVVTKIRLLDYLLALNYVLGLFASFSNPTLSPEELPDFTFQIVVGFLLMLCSYWLTAEAISAMMTMYHELYEHDYHVLNLIDYLQHNHVCSAIIKCVRRYTKVMWERQKGTWLPEMVQQGSACLRQDLFSELYLHHFHTNPVFRKLPPYILRQLVTQCKRVMLLPGRYIVRQGDIAPILYFIHEGEVEKWRRDRETGEDKLLSLLTSSGYFGTVPCLYPHFRFTCSFYTRTLVDVVYIQYETMHPLLMAYPEERKQLYQRAHNFKVNLYGNF